MGKGYHNYMSKKFFHPGNFENIKRVWMAQQKEEHAKKAEADTLAQYQKEQEQVTNRALLGDEKAKLGLNFMYDPPPGVKRDREKEEDEPEYKFEWQRKYNAPRESYAKGDDAVRDQPFGIEVRNVRCLKCRKWGHINTDKVCPMYGNSITAEPPPQSGNNPGELMEQMAEEGLAFTKKVLSRQNDPGAENQQMVDSDAEADEEIAYFLSLNRKEKKKLVKMLEKERKKKKKERKKERKSRLEAMKEQKEREAREREVKKESVEKSPPPRAPYRRRRRLSREESEEPQAKRSRSKSPKRGRDQVNGHRHEDNTSKRKEEQSSRGRRDDDKRDSQRDRGDGESVRRVKNSRSPERKPRRKSRSPDTKTRRSRTPEKSDSRSRQRSQERSRDRRR